MAALPAALIFLFFLPGLEAVVSEPLILAHLALCAAAIFALTAADLLPFLGASRAGDEDLLPTIESISAWRDSICSLIEMIWFSWVVVKFEMFMGHL
jgi:hypothetical protein